jgi:hypothetical protein
MALGDVPLGDSGKVMRRTEFSVTVPPEPKPDRLAARRPMPSSRRRTNRRVAPTWGENTSATGPSHRACWRGWARALLRITASQADDSDFASALVQRHRVAFLPRNPWPVHSEAPLGDRLYLSTTLTSSRSPTGYTRSRDVTSRGQPMTAHTHTPLLVVAHSGSTTLAPLL